MSLKFLLFLQIWGGTFYLLNKIFFSLKERTEGEISRQWRIWAWVVYIVGLPAWLVILAYESDWMVTLVEAGGAPSMILGLVIPLRRLDEVASDRREKLERRLDHFARASAVLGFGVSVYHFGGMTQLSQWAELGVVIGFLVGTYRLAKDHLDGYLWFLLMNASASTLMYMQGYKWLGLQQVASLLFVIDAYFMKRSKMGARVPVTRTA